MYCTVCKLVLVLCTYNTIGGHGGPFFFGTRFLKRELGWSDKQKKKKKNQQHIFFLLGNVLAIHSKKKKGKAQWFVRCVCVNFLYMYNTSVRKKGARGRSDIVIYDINNYIRCTFRMNVDGCWIVCICMYVVKADPSAKKKKKNPPRVKHFTIQQNEFHYSKWSLYLYCMYIAAAAASQQHKF